MWLRTLCSLRRCVESALVAFFKGMVQTRCVWIVFFLMRLTPFLLAPVLVAAASCSIGLIIPDARAQNMKDDLINHYCTKAMNADFAKAGKTPPAGMIPFTCNCMIQQVNARATIAQAKANCKDQVTAKYPTL